MGTSWMWEMKLCSGVRLAVIAGQWGTFMQLHMMDVLHPELAQVEKMCSWWPLLAPNNLATYNTSPNFADIITYADWQMELCLSPHCRCQRCQLRRKQAATARWNPNLMLCESHHKTLHSQTKQPKASRSAMRWHQLGFILSILHCCCKHWRMCSPRTQIIVELTWCRWLHRRVRTAQTKIQTCPLHTNTLVLQMYVEIMTSWFFLSMQLRPYHRPYHTSHHTSKLKRMQSKGLGKVCANRMAALELRTFIDLDSQAPWVAFVGHSVRCSAGQTYNYSTRDLETDINSQLLVIWHTLESQHVITPCSEIVEDTKDRPVFDHTCRAVLYISDFEKL